MENWVKIEGCLDQLSLVGLGAVIMATTQLNWTHSQIA